MALRGFWGGPKVGRGWWMDGVLECKAGAEAGILAVRPVSPCFSVYADMGVKGNSGACLLSSAVRCIAYSLVALYTFSEV